MKATKATIQARVDDILRIRLDGAAFHDVRQYVAEQEAKGERPWKVPEGGGPLSERQLWRYVGQADELLAVSLATQRKKRRRLHLGRREKVFARAMQASDLRTALAALDSMAKLEGLYPSEDDALLRKIDALAKALAAQQAKGTTGGDGNTQAAGAGADPAGGTSPLSSS
jgi:hypothetical protein